MTILQLPLSVDDLEYAFLKEQYAEGWGKTGKAIVLRNFCYNPGAEVDLANAASQTGGAVLTRDTVDKFSGAASFKLTGDGTNSFQGLQIYGNPAKLVSGNKYKAAARIKSASGAVAIGLQIRIEYTDASNSTIDKALALTATYDIQSSNEVTYNPAKTANGIRIILYNSLASAATYNVDEVIIWDSTKYGSAIPAFFSGGTPDDNVYDYEWEGAANNSSSVKKSLKGPPVLFENLFPDGSFEEGIIPSYTATFRCTSEIDSMNPIEGSYSAKIISTGVSGVGWGFPAAVGGPGVLPISKDEFFCIGATLRCPPGIYGRMELQWVDSGFAVISSILSPVVSSGETKFVIAQGNSVVGTARAQVVARFSDSPTFASTTPPVGAYGLVDTIQISRYPFTSYITSPNKAFTGTPWLSSAVYYDPNIDHGYLEHNYWAKQSTLNPNEQWSLADHKLNVLRNLYKSITGDLGNMVRRNLLKASGLTGAVGTFWSAQIFGGAGGSVPVLTYENTSPPAGYTKYIRAFIATVGTHTNFDVQALPAYWVPYDGKSKDLGIKFKVVAGRTFRLVAAFYDSSNVYINELGTNIIGDGNWQDFSRFVDSSLVPANTASIRFIARRNPPLADGDFIEFAVPTIEDDSTFTGAFNNETSATLTRLNADGTSDYIDPTKMSITDLWMSYLYRNSGLPITPGRTIIDHEIAYYKAQLGL